MPVLACQPTVFPADLQDQLLATSNAQEWRVLYTKSRQEKAVARDLVAREISFYLPLMPKRNYIRGKVVHSHIPVFAGYVFTYGDDDDRVSSLKTNRICCVLPVHDQELFHQDMVQIHRLISAGAPLTPERRLGRGQRVSVKSGAMKGLEGTVVCRRGRCRLIIAVNLLQQGVSVEIDECMVEPVW
jgi:transcriptional antiterminator RfaH